jgi:phosphohistidine swiveling domain-containing protein
MYRSHYYHGGLAETVSQPSSLTLSFLNHWFCGARSLGKAMKTLGLPYEPIEEGVVDVVDKELLMHLEVEEKTLYAKTVFSYRLPLPKYNHPQLKVNWWKCIYPKNIANTLKILSIQAKWMATPSKTIELAEKLCKAIPPVDTHADLERLDEVITKEVWPSVIAIGFLSEFYYQVMVHDYPEDIPLILNYVSRQISDDDWFFKSLSEQQRVKNKQLSFVRFIKEYGVRADQDYELSCPRWQEIPDTLKKRIAKLPDEKQETREPKLSPKLTKHKLVKAYQELQVLRSESKRRALDSFFQLRKVIKKKYKEVPESLTREEVLAGVKAPKNKKKKKKMNAEEPVKLVKSGNGLGVSKGSTKGTTQYIATSYEKMPKGKIGIFPNASPDFTMYYSRCKGIIFLQGGMTSHGAIVAREFGIPALVDKSASVIPDGTQIKLDGLSGRWRYL